MRRACGSIVLVIAHGLTACGGDDDDGEPTETAPVTAAAGSPCEPASSDVMTPIGNKLMPEGVRASDGRYVRSEDYERMYFVSAELDGPGLEGGGDVATWATTSVGGAEAIYAVDDLAKEYSDWRPADEVDVTIDDHGAQESRDCVGT
jgi:hypothetical protein